MEEVTARCEERLAGEALEYLAARGVSEEVARFHRLGVNGDPLPGYEQWRGRLVMPYLTPSGVVALRFRDLSGKSNAKYLSMDGAQPRLYNVAALHTGLPHVGIVEGEFKAIALTNAGLPTVGVPGSQMWLKHHPRVFADFATVFVVGDNDIKYEGEGEDRKLGPNPGQALAVKIVKSVRNAVNIVGPGNLDVDEWIMRDGADAVLEKIGVKAPISLSHAYITQYGNDQEGGVSGLPESSGIVDPDPPPF